MCRAQLSGWEASVHTCKAEGLRGGERTYAHFHSANGVRFRSRAEVFRHLGLEEGRWIEDKDALNKADEAVPPSKRSKPTAPLPNAATPAGTEMQALEALEALVAKVESMGDSRDMVRA